MTVTTLKDSLPNVRRFVDSNLASGVDHMLVFLDAPDADVEAHLSRHPQVSHVVTDARWWGERRPDGLNARQRLNANAARVALAETGLADWLFHVDGDEVALVDRELLAGVPDDVHAARLFPLESVSRADGADPTLFKRLLDDDELGLLVALGVVNRPTNQRYFHGQVTGKIGVRPGHEVRLWVHTAVDPDGEKVPRFEHPGLRHLHLESLTFEEFLRKWRALAGSGAAPGMRSPRGNLAGAVLALERLGLAPEAHRAMMRRLYERHVEDDVAALEALGFLERVDVLAAPQPSRPLAADDVRRLEALLGAFAEVPKQLFAPGRATKEVLRGIRPALRAAGRRG